ncbi:DNA polymerase III subunit beta [Bacillus phage Silence]|nr:DNA polymerase III subunit beta [Bacillus phage Silence]
MEKLTVTKKVHEGVGIEFVHGDLYGVAMEVVKKFVNKSDTRPILQYALHAANGDVIATDSHRLIKIEGIHGFGQDYIINPKNLMVAKSDRFPDISHIMANAEKDAAIAIVLNKEHVHLWFNIFKSIMQTMKAMKVLSRNKVVDLHFNDEGVSVSVDPLKLNFTLPFETYEQPEKLKRIRFNCEYMKDALEAHFKLNSPEVAIRFTGDMRPFTLQDNVMLTTLILPCRIYE